MKGDIFPMMSRDHGGSSVNNPNPVSACGLCGRDPAAGTAGAWNDGVETRLCHGDDDPTPTCYTRWLHGQRPGPSRVVGSL
jgi:hypothetical protein